MSDHDADPSFLKEQRQASRNDLLADREALRERVRVLEAAAKTVVALRALVIGTIVRLEREAPHGDALAEFRKLDENLLALSRALSEPQSKDGGA